MRLVLKKKDGTEQEVVGVRAGAPVTGEPETIPRSQPDYCIVRRQQSSPLVQLQGTHVTFYKHSWERYKLNHWEKEEWEITNHGIVKLQSLLEEMWKYDRRRPMMSSCLHVVVSRPKAFRQNLNEALNNLTVQNIKGTVDRILWVLDDGLDPVNQVAYQKALDMRKQDMAGMIVRKAVSDPDLYGDLTKAIDNRRTPMLGGLAGLLWPRQVPVLMIGWLIQGQERMISVDAGGMRCSLVLSLALGWFLRRVWRRLSVIL